MQVHLPKDKVSEIRSLAASLQDRGVASARILMTFLGKVTSASYGVELARLHSRELQTALRTVYKRPRDIGRTVHLHREALHSLVFWKELTPSPSAPPSSGDNYGNRRFVIGMGRQSSRIIGQWPLVQGSEVTPHKLPGTDGRREFASVISGQGEREDCVRPDRQQNCSGLPGEGREHKVGTSVPPGLPIPVVVPTASDNPDPCVREGNQHATQLRTPCPGGRRYNGTCHQRWWTGSFSGTGPPRSTSLPPGRQLSYPSTWTLQRGDNQALAVDALSQTWDFDLVYTFPPPTLVPTVANKLRGSKTRMLLLAPCWCDAPWMPVLTELLFDAPRRIPVSPRLLICTATNYPVGNVEALRLTVWPICGQPQASTSHLLPSRF